MEQLKEDFKKILGKKSPTRQDLVRLKHKSHNPQIVNDLVHILEDTVCVLSASKIEKLQKLYNKYFK